MRSDTDFAATQSIAPAGRAIGSANSGFDPKNLGRHQVAFFWLILFGEAKKGKSPAAATERHWNLAERAVPDSKQGFDTSARTEGRLGPNGVKEIRKRAF